MVTVCNRLTNHALHTAYTSLHNIICNILHFATIFRAAESIFPPLHGGGTWKNSFLARFRTERGCMCLAATKGWCSASHSGCLVKLHEHHAQLPLFHAFLTCGALRVWKCTQDAAAVDFSSVCGASRSGINRFGCEPIIGPITGKSLA